MNESAAQTEVLQLKPFQLAVELAQPWVLFLLYVGTAAAGWWVVAVPLAVGAALAGFVQMHDAIHRSLGVSKGGHGFVLSMCGLLLLKRRHALQVTHLRHHGQCLKHDDPEEACVVF